MVWVKDRWDFQKNLPPGLSAIRGQEVGRPLWTDDLHRGDLQWDDVIMPDGLEVVDERLEAHGFQISDGRVIEGEVTDEESGRPLNAKVTIEQLRSESEGASRYVKAVEVETDAEGRWSIRNIRRYDESHCCFVGWLCATYCFLLPI